MWGYGKENTWKMFWTRLNTDLPIKYVTSLKCTVSSMTMEIEQSNCTIRGIFHSVGLHFKHPKQSAV